jgi:L-lactate dehydrogenase complex protein LldG
MSARADILAAIRLTRTAADGPRRGHTVIPARATSLDSEGRVACFVRMAESVQATVERVEPAAVAQAVAAYLARNQLAASLVMTPDPSLDRFRWAERPILSIRRGRANEADQVGLTGAVAGIAETGTLMMASGPATPVTPHLLPDTHIAVLDAGDIVATYEDAWSKLRLAPGAMPPRTVTFITGPSRTADIEQRIELGAHGPRRLHILIVAAP